MGTLVHQYEKPNIADFSYKGKNYWVYKIMEHLYYDDHDGGAGTGNLMIEYYYELCDFNTDAKIRWNNSLWDDKGFCDAFDSSGKGVT